MGTEGIEEMVSQCFDDIPDVDICRIGVLPFRQQFADQELAMIRAAFTIDFNNEELDWAMEKLIKWIGFLALDIVMPALRVCRQMEASVVQYEAPAAPCSHPVLLVQPALGSEEAPEGPQAGWMLDMARPMPNDTKLNFLLSRRLGKPRQTCSKGWKFLTDKAQVISASLLELAPGYNIWDRSLFEKSENFFRFLRINKDQPPIRKVFLGLIEGTAELLICVRNSQSQSFKAGGTVFEFSDFRKQIMEDFITESTRILLERLMKAPSCRQLKWSSIKGKELREVPSLPQRFDRGHRELVTKLLMKTVSENVADFLDKAVDRMNRERALGESDSADLESVSDPQLSEDDSSSTSIGSGSIRVSRSRISGRTGSCSIFSGCSTSTWYPSSLSSVRTQVSLCPSTTSEETVANIATSSNEDSTIVKSPVAEQWRKMMSTIYRRSKRCASPLPVQAKPEVSSVATERTRRPSVRSRLASVFSRLLCCCKGQE